MYSYCCSYLGSFKIFIVGFVQLHVHQINVLEFQIRNVLDVIFLICLTRVNVF